MRGHNKSLTVSAAAAALDLGQRKPSHRCTRRIYSRCWPGVLPACSVKIVNGSVAYILFYDIFFFTFVLCGSFRHALPEILSIFATKPSN